MAYRLAVIGALTIPPASGPQKCRRNVPPGHLNVYLQTNRAADYCSPVKTLCILFNPYLFRISANDAWRLECKSCAPEVKIVTYCQYYSTSILFTSYRMSSDVIYSHAVLGRHVISGFV